MKTLWEKWKKIAPVIADIQLKMLLSIIFFVMLLPYKLIFLIGDLLHRKKAPASFWEDIPPGEQTLAQLRRQS
ncbi:MAG: hypothetical protein KJ893_07750 [Candidatus Omnitrophica bacterium]|nr:hypothetical protein [Candidatus Omnitrophota bacterium]MBU4479074.1 hypothetical protein [Candidatus Omnitrophota bacterium]MCG2704159.1 hypothetical protein [Candidatus Omnitrophota bacterium]